MLCEACAKLETPLNGYIVAGGSLNVAFLRFGATLSGWPELRVTVRPRQLKLLEVVLRHWTWAGWNYGSGDSRSWWVALVFCHLR